MGVVQGALARDVLQKAFRVMTGCLGFGEGGGECGPRRVFEYLFRVVGYDGSNLLRVPFGGGRRGLALGEGGQRCVSCLLVGGLEMSQGLAGGDDLLVVLAEPVPVCGGGDDEDGGVEEHREPGPVPGDGS